MGRFPAICPMGAFPMCPIPGCPIGAPIGAPIPGGMPKFPAGWAAGVNIPISVGLNVPAPVPDDFLFFLMRIDESTFLAYSFFPVGSFHPGVASFLSGAGPRGMFEMSAEYIFPPPE